MCPFVVLNKYFKYLYHNIYTLEHLSDQLLAS